MKKKEFGEGNTITGLKFERGRDILSIPINASPSSIVGKMKQGEVGQRRQSRIVNKT